MASAYDAVALLPSNLAQAKPQKADGGWAPYESMLPRPSHSNAGLHDECSRNTVPLVRTILRSKAYEKTISQRRQNNRDEYLSKPVVRPPNVPHALRRALKEEYDSRHKVEDEEDEADNEDDNSSLPGGALPKRPNAASRTPRPRFVKNGEVVSMRPVAGPDANAALTERYETPPMGSYSETHAHLAKLGRPRAPGVTLQMQRERGCVTAGRVFTWGGRLRFDTPKHDPSRDKALKERHLV